MAEQSPDLSYMDEDKIVISVIDERRRVRERGKSPNFIGVAHGVYGIPADWYVYPTLTGFEKEKKKQTLASFLEERIVFGLDDDGWNVAAAGFPLAPSEHEIASRLQTEEAARLLILTLREWYVSINLNWVSAFSFDWDTSVDVYDRKAQRILEASMSGKDIVDEKADDSPRNGILRAYRDRLVKILEDAEVRQALAPSDIDVAAQGEALQADEGESDQRPPGHGQGEQEQRGEASAQRDADGANDTQGANEAREEAAP
jgi:hypothetical protein